MRRGFRPAGVSSARWCVTVLSVVDAATLRVEPPVTSFLPVGSRGQKARQLVETAPPSSALRTSP
jgi:hypothetical protein